MEAVTWTHELGYLFNTVQELRCRVLDVSTVTVPATLAQSWMSLGGNVSIALRTERFSLELLCKIFSDRLTA